MASSAATRSGRNALRVVAVAWLLTSVYYFYQYVLRSAPAVMVPELTEAFGLTAVGLASVPEDIVVTVWRLPHGPQA